MPEQAIDWAGIRTNASHIGIREAARQAARNLPADEQARFVFRVLKRAAREGWEKAKEAALSLAEPAGKPLSSNVLTGPEIANSAAAEVKEKSRTGLAKGVLLLADDAANLAPGTALEHAPLVLAATKAFASLYPEAAAPSTVLNVAFIHQAG